MKRFLGAGALLLAIMLLAFGWPTLYRYEQWHRGSDTFDCIIRINRVTGDADMLWPGKGWVPMVKDVGSRPVAQ